jgi:hypothetical protein
VTRPLAACALGVALIVSAQAVSARMHDEYRIVGTVLKMAATQIDVKQARDGKTIKIKIDKQTKTTRDKKPAPIGDVKAGGSVVIDALGDSLEDLLAIEIRIVPPVATGGA